MDKLIMTIELTYDANIMHGTDKESIDWFYNLLKNDELILHSNEIGDEVGSVKVLKISNSSQSNSKSEDTLATCINCGNKEKITVEGFLPGSNVRISGCSKCLDSDTQITVSTITGKAPYEFVDDPPQDTVSVEDIMHATPKGREAVQKAINESIEVQNKMTKKAQNTLKESNNLNTSEEHIKDTSLDFIGCCGGGLARHEVCSHVKAYIKAQQAKLLQVIEDEVIGDKLDTSKINGNAKMKRNQAKNQLKDEQRQALKKIKERYE